MKLVMKGTPRIGRDLRLRSGTSDDAMHVHTFEWGYNDPPEIPPPSVVLDLGANVGMASALYEFLWPAARILAVEMDFENAALARWNTSATVLCAAVTSDRDGEIARYHSNVLPASYELDPRGDGVACCVSLPQLLTLVGGRADFVKMDIEGAEWSVLNVLDQWAEKVGALLIELHGGYPELAEALLEHWGYTVEPHPKHDRAIIATR